MNSQKSKEKSDNPDNSRKCEDIYAGLSHRHTQFCGLWFDRAGHVSGAILQDGCKADEDARDNKHGNFVLRYNGNPRICRNKPCQSRPHTQCHHQGREGATQ